MIGSFIFISIEHASKRIASIKTIDFEFGLGYFVAVAQITIDPL